MADLSNTDALILIFAMPGCPACETYGPMLERQVIAFRELGAPIFYYQNGDDIPPKTIPIIVLDTTSKDAEISALADMHKVTALPTTLFMSRQGNQRIEGGLSDRQIYQMLADAVKANR